MTSDFQATVTITHPEGTKTVTLQSSSARGLKQQIYALSFEDISGENLQNYNQWRADNDLKTVKLTTKK